MIVTRLLLVLLSLSFTVESSFWRRNVQQELIEKRKSIENPLYLDLSDLSNDEITRLSELLRDEIKAYEKSNKYINGLSPDKHSRNKIVFVKHIPGEIKDRHQKAYFYDKSAVIEDVELQSRIIKLEYLLKERALRGL